MGNSSPLFGLICCLCVCVCLNVQQPDRSVFLLFFPLISYKGLPWFFFSSFSSLTFEWKLLVYYCLCVFVVLNHRFFYHCRVCPSLWWETGCRYFFLFYTPISITVWYYTIVILLLWCVWETIILVDLDFHHLIILKVKCENEILNINKLFWWFIWSSIFIIIPFHSISFYVKHKQDNIYVCYK